MGRKKKERIDTSREEDFGSDAFADLDLGALPHLPEDKKPAAPKEVTKPRGRIDIKRVKAGRGGKTVTLIEGDGFLHTCPEELKNIAKDLKKSCSVGGTVVGKTIEIQGDQRERVASFLEGKGYKVVFAGG